MPKPKPKSSMNKAVQGPDDPPPRVTLSGSKRAGRTGSKHPAQRARLQISCCMKSSARNILKGQIKSVKKGPISRQVVLEIAPGLEVVSSITADSAAGLKLMKGQGEPGDSRCSPPPP